MIDKKVLLFGKPSFFYLYSIKSPWPNGYGVALRRRRLWVRLPSGIVLFTVCDYRQRLIFQQISENNLESQLRKENRFVDVNSIVHGRWGGVCGGIAHRQQRNRDNVVSQSEFRFDFCRVKIGDPR